MWVWTIFWELLWNHRIAWNGAASLGNILTIVQQRLIDTKYLKKFYLWVCFYVKFWKIVVLPKLLVKNVLCSNQWKILKAQQNSTIFIIKISVYIFCYQKNFQVKQLLWKWNYTQKRPRALSFRSSQRCPW